MKGPQKLALTLIAVALINPVLAVVVGAILYTFRVGDWTYHGRDEGFVGGVWLDGD